MISFEQFKENADVCFASKLEEFMDSEGTKEAWDFVNPEKQKAVREMLNWFFVQGVDFAMDSLSQPKAPRKPRKTKIKPDHGSIPERHIEGETIIIPQRNSVVEDVILGEAISHSEMTSVSEPEPNVSEDWVGQNDGGSSYDSASSDYSSDSNSSWDSSSSSSDSSDSGFSSGDGF
jgi:hypothetical protein